MHRAAGRAGLEQGAPVLARAVVPASDVAGLEQRSTSSSSRRKPRISSTIAARFER